MDSEPIPDIIIGPQVDVFPFFVNIFEKIKSTFPWLAVFLSKSIGIIIGLSFVVSIMLIIGIIYSVEQLKRIRKREEEIYDLKVEPAYEIVDKGDPGLANRWENVMKHINSPNQNDWRQAILEADIILDDILNKMGYRGESVGEKLKRVDPVEFESLNEAWEAHKVRNMIAHEGASFSISEVEAKRVINLYKKVFEEFYYI